MGSLPELRRLGALTPSPPASSRQTYNGPRYSVGAATNLQVRGGPRVQHNSEGASSGQQGASAPLKRRDSCASSVGAASVRRLVRPSHQQRGASAERATFRAAAVACCARALAAAALLPLQVLQGAHGLWAPGPPLLAGLHAASAGASFVAPALMHLAGVTRLIPASYLLLAAFFAAHLYPKIYVLVPLYLAAGFFWGPLALAHKNLLVGLVDGLVTRQANGGPPPAPARRALLRRLSRGSRAARDLGLFLAAMLLPLLPTLNLSSDSNLKQPNATLEIWSSGDSEEEQEVWRETWCGARACPGQLETLPGASAGLEGEGAPLAASLAACCALAALASLALPAGDKAAGPAPWRASAKALTEPRLRFVGPLGFFIGLEQGFLYAHLMQWYVVCVSGAGQPWRALVGVALLRALVACTLSMLLAHGRRRLVVVVGLMWHACLLLALSIWRAARADRQLPPVMAAAWAGCDAVWELVQATFLEEPWCGGLAALSQCFCSLGLAFSLMLRWLFCARWTLRALMVTLPAVAIPMLFTADQ